MKIEYPDMKIEYSHNFHNILKMLKIGIDMRDAKAKYPEYDLVEQIYKKYLWMSNKYEEKEIKDELKIVPKVAFDVITLHYSKQHLKPRYSENWGYEVFFNGKYQQYSIGIRNAIEAYLAKLGLKNPMVDRAVMNDDLAVKFCPIRDFFAEIRPLCYLPDVQCGDTVMDFLRPFDEEKRFSDQMSLEQIRKKIKIWGVFAVAQVLHPRFCNEIALGAVSLKQGSGKSQFMAGLTLWARNRDLCSGAMYGGSIESLRKMKGNFILHDDELGERSKSQIEKFKEVLSMKHVKYNDKYQVQELRYPRTCSYTYCANNINFLREDSRRDYTILFAESDQFNAKRIAEHCADIEINRRLWAWFLYLYENHFEEIIQEYHRFKDDITLSNKMFIESTFESDLIQRYLSIPEEGEKYWNMSLADIMTYMNKHYSTDTGDHSTKVNEKKIKDGLKMLGFTTHVDKGNKRYNPMEQKHNKTFRGYRVKLSGFEGEAVPETEKAPY